MTDSRPEAPDRAPRRRRVIAALAVLIVLVGAGTTTAIIRSRGIPKFCTAEGLIDPTDEHIYHRDINQDCKWVNEDGDLLPEQ